jgi:branched-chain amino acid transport system substrate-binding protein
LSEAIKRGAKKGTIAKDGLMKEIRTTNIDSVVGHVTFDETGDNPNFMMRIGQIQDNKIVLVWPKKLANGTVKSLQCPGNR